MRGLIYVTCQLVNEGKKEGIFVLQVAYEHILKFTDLTKIGVTFSTSYLN